MYYLLCWREKFFCNCKVLILGSSVDESLPDGLKVSLKKDFNDK